VPFPRHRHLALLAALTAAAAVLTAAGCAATSQPATRIPSAVPVEPVPPAAGPPSPSPSASARPSRTPAGAVAGPPPNAPFDYQLGGAYPPPAGVRVVSRDRGDRPAAGLYSICYVNAYQAQPQELDWWRANHDDLLLRDAAGRYVVDRDWNETLLDVSTDARRAALAGIVGGWIDGCAAAGFRAVEPDNLDSWTRSGGRLTQAHALAFARLLTARAHARHLAIAQKNTAELGRSGRDAGFDFAVAEECARYGECAAYTAVYGTSVLVVEYRRRDFDTACATVGPSLSVVLRDRDVSVPGTRGYLYDSC